MPVRDDAIRRTRLNGAQNASASACWARDGDACAPCARARAPGSEVPLCQAHLRRGDDAMRVVTHPTLGGKILIAAVDLPKGYKSVYFGERKSWRECGRAGRDHAMHFRARGGVIDPTPLGEGAQLQFMANPGPNEVSNNRSTNVFFGDAKCERGTIVGREFILTKPVKRGEQLLQWYGAEWFASRNIKRLDVGCEEFPAQRKRKRRALGDATNAR